MFETAVDRNREAEVKARRLFAIALGYPALDEDHPLPDQTERGLDGLFTSFKGKYATRPRSAWARESYRERLKRAMSDQK